MKKKINILLCGLALIGSGCDLKGFDSVDEINQHSRKSWDSDECREIKEQYGIAELRILVPERCFPPRPELETYGELKTWDIYHDRFELQHDKESILITDVLNQHRIFVCSRDLEEKLEYLFLDYYKQRLFYADLMVLHYDPVRAENWGSRYVGELRSLIDPDKLSFFFNNQQDELLESFECADVIDIQNYYDKTPLFLTQEK